MKIRNLYEVLYNRLEKVNGGKEGTISGHNITFVDKGNRHELRITTRWNDVYEISLYKLNLDNLSKDVDFDDDNLIFEAHRRHVYGWWIKLEDINEIRDLFLI